MRKLLTATLLFWGALSVAAWALFVEIGIGVYRLVGQF
jgi:hypothetical protein